MSAPRIKLGLSEDRAPVDLSLTPMQHAAVELAVKFLLARIDANDYSDLAAATVKEFAYLRTTLFGIQSILRCAQLDADIQPERRSLREGCTRNSRKTSAKKNAPKREKNS